MSYSFVNLLKKNYCRYKWKVAAVDGEDPAGPVNNNEYLEELAPTMRKHNVPIS